ncbi:MAG TPA: sigma-70 family RNA polymerase sigma factor [Methylomirabilota bacterium]|nr:sigma-70 family RNA polymerase sigma factor [Methylomirabilota bacterium]
MQAAASNIPKKEMTCNEETLVRRALTGDSEALEALFARDNRALYQTALRLLGNAEDAEDALQEGLLAAYRNLRRFQRRSKFSTWLTRIVINAALMRRRSQKSRPAASLDEWLTSEEPIVSGRAYRRAGERLADAGPNPEQIYVGREMAERLEEGLRTLSPVLRKAFRMRELQGLSAEETAAALGVSRNALKARLWRARHLLTERLRATLQSPFSGTESGQEA